jgi:hypothetical protein
MSSMLCTSFEFLNLHENMNFGSVFQDKSQGFLAVFAGDTPG